MGTIDKAREVNLPWIIIIIIKHILLLYTIAYVCVCVCNLLDMNMTICCSGTPSPVRSDFRFTPILSSECHRRRTIRIAIGDT